MNEQANFPLLAGKLAFITGAASGIGRAIAVAYARAGARVVLSDRSAQACAPALAEVREHSPDSRALALDVTDAAAAVAVAELVARECGPIDVLVNNAGIMIREGIDHPQVQQNVRQTMEVNFFGTFHLIHAFVPALRASRGCIINIASVAALNGARGSVGYSASKGAVKLLTQSMAADLGGDGIRVNAIAPGVTETPMTEYTLGNPKRLEGFLNRIPSRRVGQPQEMASVAVFLASDMASYVNGVLLPVDGGLHAV